MLAVHRALQGMYYLKGDHRYHTALLHKEWPETNPRPEKDGRRGNFDLVILDPADIEKCSIKDFSTGRISPKFVVEMSLNYKLDHLRDDDLKLKNSDHGKNGYIVHLWQPHKGIADDEVKELVELCRGQHHVAAAVFVKERLWLKHLKDPELILRAAQ